MISRNAEKFCSAQDSKYGRILVAARWCNSHTAKATMHMLTGMFEDRIISQNSDFPWPPRSPDWSMPDFFLWGNLEEKVYVNKPPTIQQLKANIQTETHSLQPQMLRTITENAVKRARVCEAEYGGNLRNIIFRT